MTTTISTRSPSTLNPTRQQLDELDVLLQRMLELPVNKVDDVEQDAAEEEPADADLDERPPVILHWSSAPAAEEENTPPPHSAPQPMVPPPSYMVIETASPRPLPPASGFEPRPSALTPRLEPVTTPRIDKPEPQAAAPTEATASSATPAPPRSEMPAPPSEPEAWVPLRSTWQPTASTWQPLADSWHQAQSVPPIPEAMPSPIATPRLDLSPSQPVAASQADSELPSEKPDNEAAPTAFAPAPAAEPRLSLSAEDAPAEVPTALLPLLWFNQGFDACLAPLGAAAGWLCGPHGRQLLGLIGLACLTAAAIIAVLAGMGWTW